jgi:hypothetical protein
MASTCRIGCTVPEAAWRSSNTCSEKNLTTSTNALVAVTPCCKVNVKMDLK